MPFDPDLSDIDQMALNLAWMKILQQGGLQFVMPQSQIQTPVQESAPLAEAIQHAPAGGASIAGKRYTGGQFIPAAEMAKASPQEKATLAWKPEQAKDQKTTKAGELSPAPKQQPSAAPSLDDMARYQQYLGHLSDPGDGQHKEIAKQKAAELEAKYGKHRLLGLEQGDTAENRDLNYAIQRIKTSAPPETLEHFRKVLDAVRSEHPEWNEALLRYQGPAFHDINKRLRDRQPLDQIQQAVAENLTKAIDAAGKLPKPVTTYRGLSFAPEDYDLIMQRFKQGLAHGGGFVERGFVSQSLNPQVAQAYLNSKGPRNGKILLKITATRGLFGDTGETELIQKPGTRFKIAAIDESGRYPVVTIQEAA